MARKPKRNVLISVKPAVDDAPAALAWYRSVLGATELWNLGSVVGLEIDGAPVFLGEPENNGSATPLSLGLPSVRIEVFTDDPEGFIARAVAAGADGSHDPIRVHQMPWGPHRQGGFIDPFGPQWLLGGRASPNTPPSGLWGSATVRGPPQASFQHPLVRPH